MLDSVVMVNSEQLDRVKKEIYDLELQIQSHEVNFHLKE